jgi:long-chain acyl-CoA synthetase
MPEMLRAAAARTATRIAFTQCMPNGMNGSLRFRDVDRLSDEFAAYLREVAGLEAGDRVAVQMPNCLSYPVVAFGVLKAGCVLVNTNPLYTASEMTHQFADSGARAWSSSTCSPTGCRTCSRADGHRDGGHGPGRRVLPGRLIAG